MTATSSETKTKDSGAHGIFVPVNLVVQSSEKRSYLQRSLDALRVMFELFAKILPGLALLLGLLLFRQEISSFLGRASKIEVFGIKMEKEVFERRLQAAAIKIGKTKEQPTWTAVPFRKLNLAAPLLNGMRILWVDDHPENNFFLRRILTELGVQVVVSLSNKEALDQIYRLDFDILISDFGRDPPLHETGGDFARELIRIGYEAPLLFYTANPENVPAGTRQILKTNDPAELLSTIAELAVQQRK